MMQTLLKDQLEPMCDDSSVSQLADKAIWFCVDYLQLHVKKHSTLLLSLIENIRDLLFFVF